MRKKFLFHIMLLMLLMLLTLGLLAACAGDTADPQPPTPEVADEPPQLIINYGGQSITAWRGSYSWARPLGGGTVEHIIADSIHPLEAWQQGSLPRLVRLGEGELLLELEPQPTRIELTAAWSDDIVVRCGNTTPEEMQWLLEEYGELDTTGLLAGETLCPAGQSAVYLLTAHWELPQDLGGSANYAFYLPQWPLDLDDDQQITAADQQLAADEGLLSDAEFIAHLQSAYQMTAAEAEQLLAGELSLLCGISTHDDTEAPGTALVVECH